jgi:hypothetical protein
MSLGTGKIISAAVPDCLTSPLIVKCRPTSATVGILDLGMNGLLSAWRFKVDVPNGREGIKSFSSRPR